ncbi:MAG: hypothetical protein JRM82_02475 [Nitrososphaerota archaeon]|nr:hypothetical protein [Nitrososphaerota archaeon]
MNVRTALLGLFVVLTIALASTAVYESGSRSTFTSTSTLTQKSTVTATSVTTAVSTSTSVSTQDVTITTTQSGAVANYSSVATVTGYGSAVFHSSNEVWSFSVTFNNLEYAGQGDTIYAYVNLTNISNQTQKVQEVSPLVDPVLYCSSQDGMQSCSPGQQVWSWFGSGVSGIHLVNVTARPGSWYVSGPYPISIPFEFGNGGEFTLSMWPLIEPGGTAGGGYQVGQSLMINATLGQSLMINDTIPVS